MVWCWFWRIHQREYKYSMGKLKEVGMLAVFKITNRKIKMLTRKIWGFNRSNGKMVLRLRKKVKCLSAYDKYGLYIISNDLWLWCGIKWKRTCQDWATNVTNGETFCKKKKVLPRWCFCFRQYLFWLLVYSAI